MPIYSLPPVANYSRIFPFSSDLKKRICFENLVLLNYLKLSSHTESNLFQLKINWTRLITRVFIIVIGNII